MIKQQVLWLEVSMDDVQFVQVLHASDYLVEELDS